jgi:zinc transport system ATP-binding protein
MKTLLMLLQPVGGEVTYGEDLKRVLTIGYLPQMSEHQKDFPATVWEIVLSGTMGRRRGLFYRKEQKALAKHMLEELGIVQLRNKSYRSLSGGQQQRVLLARALCATEKLLLLDEPVTGLDPHATKQLYQILDRLHRNGTAILMITHDIKAIDHASHVLHLDAKKPFYGTKTRYLESKQWKILKEWERGEENVC